MEDRIEHRLTKLETNTSHLQEDVRDIKNKLDVLAEKLTAFQLETRDSFARLVNARWADKVYWLAIAGTLLAVMARGFKWI